MNPIIEIAYETLSSTLTLLNAIKKNTSTYMLHPKCQ